MKNNVYKKAKMKYDNIKERRINNIEECEFK